MLLPGRCSGLRVETPGIKFHSMSQRPHLLPPFICLFLQFFKRPGLRHPAMRYFILGSKILLLAAPFLHLLLDIAPAQCPSSA